MKRKPLPDMGDLKHITLSDINDVYQLYEDGRIFTKHTGKFLKKTLIRGKEVYGLVDTTGVHRTVTVDLLIKKYFEGLPEFEFVKHVPLVGNEDDYQVYSDGRIFSKRQYMFLTPKKTQTNWKFVCILDQGWKRKTLYCARAVWESFVGPIGIQEKLRFIDEDRQNCSLENLDVVMKGIYSE